MANICDFEMIVRGEKKNVDAFIEALHQNGNIHIGYGANFDTDEELLADGNCRAVCSGWVKWSIGAALMMPVGDEKMNEIINAVLKGQNPDDFVFEEEKTGDIVTISLPQASACFHVDVEVYSEESGCCFQEHYLIRKGKVIIHQCVNFAEYWGDDCETKEELEEALGMPITEDEWNSVLTDDKFVRGGFPNWVYAI